MAGTPKPLRPGAYIDEDATDAFLDGPEPLYPDGNGGGREMTWADIEARREERRVSGEPLPPWPRTALPE